MHVEHLSLHDFRSYATAEIELRPGVTTLVGDNGQGKTNIVEALAYLATLGSHRVATDAALVRAGSPRAVVRARLRRAERGALVEIEITPGRANRAQVNRSPVPRPREVLGLLRTVVFAPEDLSIVKAEPDGRRRFLDDLLVASAPRYAGVRADYERVVRQRSALLKSTRAMHGTAREAAAATLDVWDSQLAQVGAELLAGRLSVLAALEPHAVTAYGDVSGVADAMRLRYRARGLHPSMRRSEEELPEPPTDRVALHDALLAAAAQARPAEVERGTSLVGPHRDDVDLCVNGLPARGYASHGESWSAALALRLGSFDLLRADGGDGGEPVLVLDDVFAELDVYRRRHLAERAVGAEQAIITAAVAADVPDEVAGRVLHVSRDPVTTLSSVSSEP